MDAEAVRHELRRAQIFTVGELAGRLGASLPTARRRLRDWDAHTSYNCNGRYYALPGVPLFDAEGLWQCRAARFSRYGNLRETVAGLVRAAPAGLTAPELSAALGLEARTFLAHLRDRLGLAREACGRGYVWLAEDAAVREPQWRARQELLAAATDLTAAEAVMVLVELVRHPQFGPVELTAALRATVPRLSPARIERFLDRHGLAEKKRASRSPSRCGRRWPD